MEGFGGGLIVSLINCSMVFLVLGGLALAINGLKKAIDLFQQDMTAQMSPRMAESPSPPTKEKSSPPDAVLETHIAAIVTALQQFTSLAPGSFTINSIEPIRAEDAAAFVDERQRKALIAAITVAIHEYTLMPIGSFHITGMTPVGQVNPWKIAGRLESIGIDAR